MRKRSELNKDIREQRFKEIDEDLSDLSCNLAFKRKRLTQAEHAKDYKMCDKITEEILDCKIRMRELEKA